MSERPLPNYRLIAACCRHAAATADAKIKAGLEEGAAILDYLGERPELVRAIAYFAADPLVLPVLRDLPEGTKLAALN